MASCLFWSADKGFFSTGSAEVPQPLFKSFISLEIRLCKSARVWGALVVDLTRTLRRPDDAVGGVDAEVDAAAEED